MSDLFDQVDEMYKGTDMEGLDAFDRQLKRFEIVDKENPVKVGPTVHLAENLRVFLEKDHKDLIFPLTHGQYDVLTDEIFQEYVIWCQTDEGRMYLAPPLSEKICKNSPKPSTMTLDEAIEHCKEKEDCTACGQEHRQLREWLEDYRDILNYFEKSATSHLVFSQRKKLADRYERWANNAKAVDVPFSVITFLSSTGLINVERARMLLSDGDD